LRERHLNLSDAHTTGPQPPFYIVLSKTVHDFVTCYSSILLTLPVRFNKLTHSLTYLEKRVESSSLTSLSAGSVHAVRRPRSPTNTRPPPRRCFLGGCWSDGGGVTSSLSPRPTPIRTRCDRVKLRSIRRPPRSISSRSSTLSGMRRHRRHRDAPPTRSVTSRLTSSSSSSVGCGAVTCHTPGSFRKTGAMGNWKAEIGAWIQAAGRFGGG